MLPAGDLRDLAAAIAPRPLRIAAAVDHLNRVASAEALKAEYERAASVYQSAGVPTALELSTERAAVARWLDEQIH
jgi:hypothetical protein